MSAPACYAPSYALYFCRRISTPYTQVPSRSNPASPFIAPTLDPSDTGLVPYVLLLATCPPTLSTSAGDSLHATHRFRPVRAPACYAPSYELYFCRRSSTRYPQVSSRTCSCLLCAFLRTFLYALLLPAILYMLSTGLVPYVLLLAMRLPTRSTSAGDPLHVTHRSHPAPTRSHHNGPGFATTLRRRTYPAAPPAGHRLPQQLVIRASQNPEEPSAGVTCPKTAVNCEA
jgi:hypothetical protein